MSLSWEGVFAYAVDAMSLSWEGMFAYAFLPFRFIAPVLIDLYWDFPNEEL
jgi:hypothetical protein